MLRASSRLINALRPKPNLLQTKQFSNSTLLSLPSHLIVYDGVCGIGNAGIRFVIKNDHNKVIKFAQVTSNTTQQLLSKINITTEDALNRFIYIEDEQVYRASTAALKIAAHLQFPFPFLEQLGFLIPTIIRDFLYDIIAKNRYQWFGKYDTCVRPSSQIMSRFIDAVDLEKLKH